MKSLYARAQPISSTASDCEAQNMEGAVCGARAVAEVILDIGLPWTIATPLCSHHSVAARDAFSAAVADA